MLSGFKGLQESETRSYGQTTLAKSCMNTLKRHSVSSWTITRWPRVYSRASYEFRVKQRCKADISISTNLWNVWMSALPGASGLQTQPRNFCWLCWLPWLLSCMYDCATSLRPQVCYQIGPTNCRSHARPQEKHNHPHHAPEAQCGKCSPMNGLVIAVACSEEVLERLWGR